MKKRPTQARRPFQNVNRKLARPARFERATAWFVARYSIQLSYGRRKTVARDEGRVARRSARLDVVREAKYTPFSPTLASKILGPRHSVLGQPRNEKGGQLAPFFVAWLAEDRVARAEDFACQCGGKWRIFRLPDDIESGTSPRHSSLVPRHCFSAPVAQLDRVPGYEPGGRTFESCRARQFPVHILKRPTCLRRPFFHESLLVNVLSGCGSDSQEMQSHLRFRLPGG